MLILPPNNKFEFYKLERNADTPENFDEYVGILSMEVEGQSVPLGDISFVHYSALHDREDSDGNKEHYPPRWGDLFAEGDVVDDAIDKLPETVLSVSTQGIWYLDYVGIHESARGQGLGKLLVSSATESIRKMGGSGLIVLYSLPGLEGFHESNGFIRSQHQPQVFFLFLSQYHSDAGPRHSQDEMTISTDVL